MWEHGEDPKEALGSQSPVGEAGKMGWHWGGFVYGGFGGR